VEALKVLVKCLWTAEDIRSFLSVVVITPENKTVMHDLLLELFVTKPYIKMWSKGDKAQVVYFFNYHGSFTMAAVTPRALVVLDEKKRHFGFFLYSGRSFGIIVPYMFDSICQRPWEVYWSADGRVIKLETIRYRPHTSSAVSQAGTPLTTRAIVFLPSQLTPGEIQITKYVDLETGLEIEDSIHTWDSLPRDFYNHSESAWMQKTTFNFKNEMAFLNTSREVRADIRYRHMGSSIAGIAVTLNPIISFFQSLSDAFDFRNITLNHKDITPDKLHKKMHEMFTVPLILAPDDDDGHSDRSHPCSPLSFFD
jgi:hypothetical protein